jgi:hypothetical protein
MQDRLPASSGKEILEARFGGAFKTAHWFLIFSAILRMIGIIGGIVGIWSFLISFIPKSGIDTAGSLATGVSSVLGGLIASTVVSAVGHLLNATLVTAVNTSTIATDQEKEEIISENMPVFVGWAGFRFTYRLKRTYASAS